MILFVFAASVGLVMGQAPAPVPTPKPVSKEDQITVKVIKVKGSEKVLKIQGRANAEPLTVIAKYNDKPKWARKEVLKPWETFTFEYVGSKDFVVEGWEGRKMVDQETATKKTGTSSFSE